MVHRAIARRAILLAVAAASITVAVSPPLLADETPPATTSATTIVATTAATSAPATVAVKRGEIRQTIDADGYFDLVDPFEVRFKPEAYQGELKILSVVAHGAAVQKGETILQLDSTDAKLQLAAAENALTAATANFIKAQSDLDLGDQSDALSLRVAQDQLKAAEEAVSWYEKVDGPQLVKKIDLGVKQEVDAVGDQQDELDQLRKMYKSEELTNATADIVVKRAVRSLENSKISLEMEQQTAEKRKATDVPRSKQRVQDNFESEKQQLVALQAAQAQARVLRQTSLTAAKAAADSARRKVDELKSDLASFTVVAPSDGVVSYGRLAQGAWVGSSLRAVRVGQNLEPNQVALTFFTPGKTRAIVDLSEVEAARLDKGQVVRVIPVGRPELESKATVETVSGIPAIKRDAVVFEQPLAVDRIDPRILPGAKFRAYIELPPARDVLVLASKLVKDGKVTLIVEGKEESRAVVVGRSDAENTEIVAGLKDGDRVLKK